MLGSTVGTGWYNIPETLEFIAVNNLELKTRPSQEELKYSTELKYQFETKQT